MDGLIGLCVSSHSIGFAGSTGRTLVVREKLISGSTVAAVALSGCIHPTIAAGEEQVSECSEGLRAACSHTPPEGLAVIFRLAYHSSLGTASPFYAYISALPASVPTLLHCSDDEYSSVQPALRDTTLHARLERARPRLHARIHKLVAVGKQLGLPWLSYNRLLWAHCMFSSRAMAIPRPPVTVGAARRPMGGAHADATMAAGAPSTTGLLDSSARSLGSLSWSPTMPAMVPVLDMADHRPGSTAEFVLLQATGRTAETAQAGSTADSAAASINASAVKLVPVALPSSTTFARPAKRSRAPEQSSGEAGQQQGEDEEEDPDPFSYLDYVDVARITVDSTVAPLQGLPAASDPVVQSTVAASSTANVHEPAPLASAQSWDNLCVGLKLGTSHAPGQAIAISYGALSSSTTAMRYGFVMDSNPADVLLVRRIGDTLVVDGSHDMQQAVAAGAVPSAAIPLTVHAVPDLLLDEAWAQQLATGALGTRAVATAGSGQVPGDGTIPDHTATPVSAPPSSSSSFSLEQLLGQDAAVSTFLEAHAGDPRATQALQWLKGQLEGLRDKLLQPVEATTGSTSAASCDDLVSMCVAYRRGLAAICSATVDMLGL